MKAAILEALEKLVVKEVELPRIGKDEALLKVKACAVCGSDIRIFHHGNTRVKPPTIIGHEISGEIVEAGDEVKNFKKGDKVAIGADVPCGECFYCQNGMGNNCAINYAIGYQFSGGFSEYMVLNSLTLRHGPVHHLPKGLTFAEGALAEPLACCLNALELSHFRSGADVVIFGAGPIGCMLVELSKTLGAKKVIVTQRSEKRLKLAKKFGADLAISSKDPGLISKILEETSGGSDVVLTACPSVDAQAQAIQVVKNRGFVNLFGGLPKDAPKLCIESNIIHYKEIFVHGSHGSVPRHHKRALDLIASGKVKIKNYITHRFPLAHVNDAFAAAESKEGLKVIVEDRTK